jgi:hypothetical protein
MILVKDNKIFMKNNKSIFEDTRLYLRYKNKIILNNEKLDAINQDLEIYNQTEKLFSNKLVNFNYHKKAKELMEDKFMLETENSYIAKKMSTLEYDLDIYHCYIFAENDVFRLENSN